MKTHLRTAYLVLLAGLAACIVVIASTRRDGLTSSVAVNLSTEVVGILLTLLLIERALAKRDEANQRQYARIAFELLRFPLSEHVRLWATIVKASLPSYPKTLPKCIDDLLIPDILNELKTFYVYAAAPVFPSVPWTRHMNLEIQSFVEKANAVIDKYAMFLTPEEVEAIEACVNSSFTRVFPSFLNLHEIEDRRQNGRIFAVSVPGASETQVFPVVPEHLRSLSNLIAKLTSVTQNPKGVLIRDDFWNDKTSPKIGSARKP